jgi:polyketide synthase 12
VVLNSLAGPYIARSLALLAPYGRFLEIGKVDIHLDTQIGLSPFRNNLSYHAIDLDRVCRERPALARTLLDELHALFEASALRPLPRRTFPIEDAVAAFRWMAQRRNIGKVVVTVGTGTATSVRADATYIVTGGLGALGLATAEWLAGAGARHLVLVGRRPPGGVAAPAIARLRSAGVRVDTAAVDVADPEAVAALIARIRDTLPPLRGIVHAAGVLDDARLADTSAERLAAVLAPKVAGAWNLHRSTADIPLDFFVLYASVAAVVGSPGQAAYAAANAYLDALAHHRRALGLTATAVDWGPWAEIGMAATAERHRMLALAGFNALAPARALSELARVLVADHPQLAIVDADWHRLASLLGGRTAPPLLADLVTADRAAPSAAGDDGLRTRLAGASGEQRRELLTTRLREKLGRVLGMAADEVDPRTSLDNLGLDSLMALELKDEIETTLGITLSLESFLEDPCVGTLVDHVLGLLELPDAA